VSAGREDERARRLALTQQSWNVATRAHNAHKRDQAAFLKEGGTTLFPEERALMAAAVGPLTGKRLLHILCNSGQDSLSWAREGADVVGVDLSDEAIATARALATDSAIPARFIESEAIAALEGDVLGSPHGFDVVFGSYGCLPWIEDLPRLFAGCRRQLKAGGALVVVEFHPLVWSFGPGFSLKDPYFAPGRAFEEPVGDYVGASGAALAPSGFVEANAPYENPHVSSSYQHTVADMVSALLGAGFSLTSLHEWPYANGCKVIADLVPQDGARFVMPADKPSLPLMVGFTARAA
jgi:SAM-dependent methyltransferase